MKKSIIIFLISLSGFLKSYAQTSDSLQNKKFLSEKVNIAGIVKGEISKEVMLNSKGLSFDDKASSTYHITSFRMTIVTREAAPKEFYNEKSGELTEAMRDAIKNAPSGSKIFVEYIKCADKNNLTHSLYAADFILK